LSGTVTAGIVSALHRTVVVAGEGPTHAVLIDAIQADAAINPGNSGGALMNCAGQIVGIPSAGATVPTPRGQPASGGDVGLGFAIPIDLAKTISDQLIANDRVTHASSASTPSRSRLEATRRLPGSTSPQSTLAGRRPRQGSPLVTS
jgi:putative serine protease PepD